MSAGPVVITGGERVYGIVGPFESEDAAHVYYRAIQPDGTAYLSAPTIVGLLAPARIGSQERAAVPMPAAPAAPPTVRRSRPLGPTAERVLTYVREHGPFSDANGKAGSSLAAELDIEGSHLAGILKHLEERGLITRRIKGKRTYEIVYMRQEGELADDEADIPGLAERRAQRAERLDAAREAATRAHTPDMPYAARPEAVFPSPPIETIEEADLPPDDRDIQQRVEDRREAVYQAERVKY